MSADSRLRVSGFWDTGLEMPVGERHLEIAPKGCGRPWWPLVSGRATFTATARGDYDFTFIDAPKRGRVGIRRWVKHLARMVRRSD